MERLENQNSKVLSTLLIYMFQDWTLNTENFICDWGMISAG